MVSTYTLLEVGLEAGEGDWATVDPGVDDKRLFVLDEEFASALNCAKSEDNTLSTIIRSMWDSGNLDPLIPPFYLIFTPNCLGSLGKFLIIDQLPRPLSFCVF